MNETSKSMVRRLHDSRFVNKYFVGDGINVGAGTDHLSFYGSLFPLMRAVKEWDLEDGDGMLLEGIEDESVNFVHSSHCLEHLENPTTALQNWIRVVKPGGHIIFTVPEEDLFEHGIWPSLIAGTDHKTSWTIGKTATWSPSSINMIAFVAQFLDKVAILKIELIDRMYLYEKELMDQTILPAGHECAIEVILRKKTEAEIVLGGRLDQRHLDLRVAVEEGRKKAIEEADKNKYEEQNKQEDSEV